MKRVIDSFKCNNTVKDGFGATDRGILRLSDLVLISDSTLPDNYLLCLSQFGITSKMMLISCSTGEIVNRFGNRELKGIFTSGFFYEKKSRCAFMTNNRLGDGNLVVFRFHFDSVDIGNSRMREILNTKISDQRVSYRILNSQFNRNYLVLVSDSVINEIGGIRGVEVQYGEDGSIKLGRVENLHSKKNDQPIFGCCVSQLHESTVYYGGGNYSGKIGDFGLSKYNYKTGKLEEFMEDNPSTIYVVKTIRLMGGKFDASEFVFVGSSNSLHIFQDDVLMKKLATPDLSITSVEKLDPFSNLLFFGNGMTEDDRWVSGSLYVLDLSTFRTKELMDEANRFSVCTRKVIVVDSSSQQKKELGKLGMNCKHKNIITLANDSVLKFSTCIVRLTNRMDPDEVDRVQYLQQEQQQEELFSKEYILHVSIITGDGETARSKMILLRSFLL